MKERTKQTLKGVIIGILIYVVEIVFIFGLVKLICKIVDMIKARKYDKHNVKLPSTVKSDEKPSAKTTWKKIEPLFVESEGRPRTVKSFTKLTNLSFGAWAKDITDNFSHDTYATLIHNGGALDIVFTKRKTLVVEGPGYEYEIDDDLLKMRILKPGLLDRVVEIDSRDKTKTTETKTTKPIDGTTWGMLKPYVLESDDDIKVSIFKVWEDATMKDVINNILQYYITTKALVSVIYNGKALDVWVTPGTKTLYLDRANKMKFEVDDDFMNMKVKKTNENIHLALIED